MELLDQICNYSLYIQNFGYAAILILSVTIILHCHIPLIPFAVIAGICGFLFGFQQGIFIAWGSVIGGSFIAFNVYRYFKLDRYTGSILSRFKIMPQIHDKWIISFIMIMHNIPVIPIAVPNIVAAMSKISLSHFLRATAAGLLIPCVLFTGFGAGIETFMTNPSIYTVVPVLVILSSIILLRYVKLDQKFI